MCPINGDGVWLKSAALQGLETRRPGKERGILFFQSPQKGCVICVSMSRWYRPPTPTLYESLDEELDALDLEGVRDAEEGDNAGLNTWSPAVYAAQDESDDEDEEHFDVDEEDMHAYGIPAARGWRLDARYVHMSLRKQPKN